MPHLALVVLALLTAGDPPSPTPIEIVSALETALADAIEKAEPSVVAIARDKDGKGEATTAVRGRGAPPSPAADLPAGFGPFRPFDDVEIPDYIASDYGSGVVIGERGEILTAFGVVKGASRLVVRSRGMRDFDALVIAADPRSDLAVIAPADPALWRRAKFRPSTIGDASRLRKGNFLLALGNPFNAGRDGRASASWGILANIARKLEPPAAEATTKLQLRNYPTLLQLDSKLNLGMSGGAVVNLKGELVGLTTNAANAGGFDSQAGYALPIDALSRRAIEALRQGKEVEYGFLGVVLPKDKSNRIEEVTAGTPAGEGGLFPQDVILAIGGVPVTDSDTLVMAVNSFNPGEPIPVRIRRDEREFDKTVILAKLLVDGEVIVTNRPPAWRGLRVDFVSTDPRSARGNLLLEAMARGGVLITSVDPGSAADDANLKVGQIITAVAGQPIKNPVDFARATADKRGPVDLTTEGTQTTTVK